MDHHGILLDTNVKYLEYGAGRGLLSHYLHERVEDNLDLVEEKSPDVYKYKV